VLRRPIETTRVTGHLAPIPDAGRGGEKCGAICAGQFAALRLLATMFHFLGCAFIFPTPSAHANPTDLISELNALGASATSADSLMKGIVAILHGKLNAITGLAFICSKGKQIATCSSSAPSRAS
jgi:hypothetical protein